MFDLLFYAFAFLVLVFGLVVFFGAPYLPTFRAQYEQAFKLLDLKPGQTLLELGSGDGRVLAAAAKKGIYAIGYELNPLLVLWTKARYIKYSKYIDVRWGNYWQQAWPPADGLFVFLLDRYMSKLDKKIVQEYGKQNLRVVSYTFKIPAKKIQKTSGAMYLYVYNSSNSTKNS